MNRRDLLAAGSVSILLGGGGCLAELEAGDENTTEDNGNEDPDNGDEPPSRELSVERIDDAPDEYGVNLKVELLTASLTGDVPPELEITIANTGEKMLVTNVSTVDAVRFSWSSPAVLYLLTESEREGRELHSDGCWSKDTVPDRENPSRVVKHLPGESETVRRTPLPIDDNPAEERLTDGCPEPGQYSFRTSFSIRDPDEGDEELFPLGEGESVECGFTLEVVE